MSLKVRRTWGLAWKLLVSREIIGLICEIEFWAYFLDFNLLNQINLLLKTLRTSICWVLRTRSYMNNVVLFTKYSLVTYLQFLKCFSPPVLIFETTLVNKINFFSWVKLNQFHNLNAKKHFALFLYLTLNNKYQACPRTWLPRWLILRMRCL